MTLSLVLAGTNQWGLGTPHKICFFNSCHTRSFDLLPVQYINFFSFSFEVHQFHIGRLKKPLITVNFDETHVINVAKGWCHFLCDVLGLVYLNMLNVWSWAEIVPLSSPVFRFSEFDSQVSLTPLTLFNPAVNPDLLSGHKVLGCTHNTVEPGLAWNRSPAC